MLVYRYYARGVGAWVWSKITADCCRNHQSFLTILTTNYFSQILLKFELLHLQKTVSICILNIIKLPTKITTYVVELYTQLSSLSYKIEYFIDFNYKIIFKYSWFWKIFSKFELQMVIKKNRAYFILNIIKLLKYQLWWDLVLNFQALTIKIQVFTGHRLIISRRWFWQNIRLL